MKSKAQFLFTIFVGLFLVAHDVTAAPDGCSSADFRVARSFDTTLNSLPLASYAAADFDGDGKPDLAVIESFSNTVAVLLNDGTGWFGAARKYEVGASASAVAVGDVNGDGRLDLVVTNAASNNVSVLLGTGGGLFAGATNFAVGTDPRTVAIGDVTGDGRIDLVIGNIGINGSGSVSVLLGNGAGSFSTAPGSPLAIAGQAVAVAIADFDSNSKPDLTVATHSGFFLLMGDGMGGFAAPVEVYDPAGTAVATSDLNGDGKPDLALGSKGLVIRLGDGSGGFSAPVVFPQESGANIISVPVGDIDGDGKQDVAAAAQSPGGVTFFKGDGAGAFTRTPSYLPASNLSSISFRRFRGRWRPGHCRRQFDSGEFGRRSFRGAACRLHCNRDRVQLHYGCTA